MGDQFVGSELCPSTPYIKGDTNPHIALTLIDSMHVGVVFRGGAFVPGERVLRPDEVFKGMPDFYNGRGWTQIEDLFTDITKRIEQLDYEPAQEEISKLRELVLQEAIKRNVVLYRTDYQPHYKHMIVWHPADWKPSTEQ
jgi:hypothetical protein